MSVTDDEQRALLDRVGELSEESRAVHERAQVLRRERGDAIRAAMAAGIPRDLIAEAAGVARTAIYRLLKE